MNQMISIEKTKDNKVEITILDNKFDTKYRGIMNLSEFGLLMAGGAKYCAIDTREIKR